MTNENKFKNALDVKQDAHGTTHVYNFHTKAIFLSLSTEEVSQLHSLLGSLKEKSESSNPPEDQL